MPSFVQELVADFQRFFGEYFFLILLTNAAVGIVYLAWKLSGRPVLSYQVHLIQTYQSDRQRVVQITNLDPERRVRIDELPALISPEGSEPSSSSSSNHQQTPRVRALVVHSPTSTRPLEVQEDYSCPDTTTINLPLNSDRHIGQIYEAIQHYTDPSIAGAIIVSLHRHIARRLSNQNHLLISRLLSEIGTSEEPSVASIIAEEGAETTSSQTTTLTDTMSSSTDNNSAEATDNASVNASTQYTASPHENSADQTIAPEEVGDHTIKLKFLDDSERIVRTNLSSTIIEFKKTHFASQVSAGKTIRLIFRGQLLRDDNRSLESYGLQDNSIVHCHINNRPYTQASTQNTASSADGAGDRSNPGQLPPRPVFDEIPNESTLMRAIRIGVYYADAVPFVLFYVLTTSLQWIREVETQPEEPNAPLASRCVNRVRRWMFSILRVFIDFNDQPNLDPEDMFSNRFNLGVLFTLLFAVKFMSIWFVVLYFPQYTDAKGVFLLLVLTIFFGLYTFHNRPRALVNANRAGNVAAEHFVH